MPQAKSFDINFKPNPMQKAFIQSKAKADLFSSRMGEGKSVALAWSAFYHTRHNPKAEWAIIRDTWENIQATTLKTFFEWFPPGIAGDFHHTKRLFTWASGLAEGSVSFLGADDPQDASKLMSRELAGFAIDEPAPAVGSGGVDELVFDIAMSRLRQSGMQWYSAKLAENNPDETHWTYKKFVQPGTEGFRVHQPNLPENQMNLPSDYYQQLRRLWAHRPDLVRRFVDGEFGFQSEGKAVTPQWNDKIHLGLGLIPIPRHEIIILWDFGHNPTAIITQKTPMGHWNILDALVGDGIGVEELVHDEVLPLLTERYRNSPIWHIGDPSWKTGDQSSIARSPYFFIKKTLGGRMTDGPIKIAARVEPLRAVLTRNNIMKVDRDRASAVWHALRGGWHYHVARTGVISGEPKKNIHSHPGDAMGYGAAVLFPLGAFSKSKNPIIAPRQASYFEDKGFTIGPQRSMIIPAHGAELKVGK